MEAIFQALENLKIQFTKTNTIGDVVLATFNFAFIEQDKIIILPDDEATTGFGDFLVAQGFTVHKIKQGDEENQLTTIFNIDSQENDQTAVSDSQPTS